MRMKMEFPFFINNLFCVLVYLYGMSSGCVDLNSVTQDGKRIISNVFKMVDSVSLYTCVSHCLTVSTCKSVSYQRETRTCHLASQDSAGDPGDVHTDPEFFLTDISLWPRRLAGPCTGITCTARSKCVVDRLNNPSCVKDAHAGCGPAPDLANATKSSTGQYEGAVTQYTCLSDFLFCGTSSTHTCSSLGNWEGLSGACNRAVWYNPAIPFSELTPCPMTKDYKLVVEATPTAKTRMKIALRTVANLQLQLDMRFKYLSVTNTTFLNTNFNGAWNGTQGVNWPFVIGVKFRAEILRQNGTYKVYIDGAFHGTVGDITLDENPDTIKIGNEIQVHSVVFSRV